MPSKHSSLFLFCSQAVATLEDNTTVETSPVPFTSDPDFQEEIGWRMTWGMLENLRKKKENIKVQVQISALLHFNWNAGSNCPFTGICERAIFGWK